ncbi:retrovirus-related pol polyprotein from transposon TNT 1-94 [Tanacetum coccineum]
MLTRSMAAKLTTASASECLFADFLSKIKPKNVFEALKHLGWVIAMQEELNQFYRNKVWTLVPLPYGKIAIGSKWVFKNKKYEHGIVTKNKARLVAQGFGLAGKPVNETLYRGMIRLLMYLTVTRPDIQFSTCLCARYQANPKESHLTAVKRILREFWCTTIAFDLKLPTDNSKALPPKDFIIEFTVMNGTKPLTIYFKTFCESTRLD